MFSQPQPPALSAVINEALTQRPVVDLGALKRALDEDPASLREMAYQDLPKLNAALADFDALPPDTPHRTKIAAILAHVCVASSLGSFETGYLDRAAALAQIAVTDPDVPTDWRVYFILIRGRALTADLQRGTAFPKPWAIVAEFEGYRALAEALPAPLSVEALTAIDSTISVFTTVAMTLENNPAGMTEGLRTVDGMRERATTPISRLRIETIEEFQKLRLAFGRHDYAYMPEGLRRLRSLLEELPATDPLRRALEPGLPIVGFYSSLDAETLDGADPWAHLGPDFELELTRLSQDPERGDAARANHLIALSRIRVSEGTPQSLDEAVELSVRALSMSPPEGMDRARQLAAAGTARITRWQLFGDPGDRAELRAGIDLLAQAWDRGTEIGHYQILTGLARPLAMAYRLDDRTELAHETMIAGLRGRVWSTLLQPRAADAHLVARDAADDAYVANSMFLADGRPELAAWALEMGRGLIVHAATQGRDAAARLEELGEHELLREWREATAAAAVDQVPNALRRRVMSALSGLALADDGSPAQEFAAAVAAIPDPPSADEIRAALKALDADALVYLVPGQDAGTGVAAIIPVAEHPRWISLPELKSMRLAGFERLVADGARDLAPAATARGGVESLEELCEWAWDAAIGPIVDELGPSPRRSPRIVLIPGRELARFPWHAARRTVGGRVRYAVEDFVFSYAPSARAFCASAWSRDVPIGDGGLIVSDPDTAGEGMPLTGAREEAAAVHACFYPEARLLGRAPDGSAAPGGRGLPDEVRAWLEDPQGGALLHLACHATVQAGAGDQETAFLLLADGLRLSAEALLDALDASRHRDLALVVLAACGSGESGRGYDEAFSLATAFLTHNTRSVISTRWSVGDAATSDFMFMLHYFLREHGLRPADALRAAQLWMIRGDELPDIAPAALRAARAGRSPEDLGVWAAFVHYGR